LFAVRLSVKDSTFPEFLPMSFAIARPLFTPLLRVVHLPLSRALADAEHAAAIGVTVFRNA
jgi:hypothetical protein